jgi:LPS-assembly protein
VTLLASLAAFGLAALAPHLGAVPPVTGDVQATADSVRYDVGTGAVVLEGNAVVRRGAVVLRAASARYDPTTGEVRATGGVLLTDATRVISADAVRAIIGGEVEAEEVLAFVKDQPADLSGLRDAHAAARAGRNRITLSGERLRGDASGRLRLSNARLTLCDCGDAAPSWEVSAREADVVPGKRAILRGAVVRITPRLLLIDHPVPVFWVPWLYLPLGERQSGLLLPVIGSTGSSGFSIAEPLYLTLGRSADATLTPEYAFGPSRDAVSRGDPAVRGPGATFELRWAPAEAAEGRVELAWLHDYDAEPGGESGDRWALVGGHAQRLGARTDLAAALRLYGDPVWVRDTTPDVLGRAAPYRRSELLVSHRRDWGVAEGFASYLQPLEPDRIVAGAPYGTLGSDVRVASRWASAAAALVPVAVGPLQLDARAGAARFGPATGTLDVAGRPGVSRADARAELAAPVLVGGAVTVAPFVRGAALGYGFDEARDAAASAWGVAGAVVGTEVSRRFGTMRHLVAPRLEWRAGSDARGEVLPFPVYDELDRSTRGLLSAAPGPFQQLRAAVETRLEGPKATLARLELGQDLDLRADRLAETWTALGVAAGPFTADARVSFFAEGRGSPITPPKIPSPTLDDFTELRASLALRNHRGDGVHAGFFSVGPGGSSALVAGIDPLFDTRGTAEASAVANAGFRAAVGGARIGYDALLYGRAAIVGACGGTGERRVDAFHVQQHLATLGWESSCRCFRVAAAVSVNDCATSFRDASYHFTFDLAGLTRARGL